MLNIHFTLPQVIGYLRTIAERDPERVARTSDGSMGCVYMEHDDHIVTPVCIVGQMFADLGLLRLLMLDPTDLSGYGDQYGSCNLYAEFWNGLDNYGITATDEAKNFMRDVQSKQDGGLTWGNAFASALDDYIASQNEVLDDQQAALDRKREALANL